MFATKLSKLYFIIPLLVLWLILPAVKNVGADEVPHPSLNIPHLCVFGNESGRDWGDDDFVQIIFFVVPEEMIDTLYFRIYDPDTGGEIDEIQNGWNTSIKFSLYGGAGAYTTPDARGVQPDGDYRSGTLLEEATYGQNSRVDGKWIVFAKVNPDQGEYVDGKFIFKFIVAGVGGNDGNLYKVDCSIYSDRPTTPTDIEVFAYEWAFRFPNLEGDIIHTFPFLVDRDVTYLIHHVWDFDNDSVMYLNTPTRPGLPTYTAGNDVWAVTKYDFGLEEEAPPIPEDGEVKRWFTTTYNILEEDYDAPWAFEIQKGTFRNNEVAVYITDQNYQPIPLYSTLQPRTGLPLTIEGEDFIPGLVALDEDVLLDQSVVVRSDIVVRAGSVLPKGTTIGKGTLLTQDIVVRGGRVIPAGTVLEEDAVLEETLILRTDMTLKPGSILVPETLLASGSQVYEGLVPGPDTLPFCNTVVLDASRSRDPDGNLLTFFWDMGDGTKLQGVRVVHTYKAPGSYVVTVFARDNSGAINDVDTDAVTIIINDPPQAEAGPSRIACIGEPISFDGTKSYDPDGGIVKYNWYFGDGSSVEGAIVEHAFEEAGSYNVRLVVTDNSDSECNTDSDGLIVIVNEPPIAEAGANITSCDKTIQFDGTRSSDPDGEITEYLWYFGDGTVGKGPRPSHTYEQPGIYKVRLEVLDDSPAECNKAFDDLTVAINSSPIAEAGPDRKICIGEPIYFDGTGSFDPDGELFKYIWDFGDGQSAEQPATVHEYKEPGVYKVTLTVQDNSNTPCAISTDQATVTVETSPIAKAGEDKKVGVGDEVSFDGSESYDPNNYPLAYKWTFGDLSDPAEGEQVTHVYQSPGVYHALLSVKNQAESRCNNSTDEVIVTVNYPPEARTEGVKTTYQSGPVTFDGTPSFDRDGEITKYEWDFGDGSPIATGAIVEHTYPESGRYTVILTVTDDSGLPGGVDSDTVMVIINTPPIAKLGPPQTVCIGRVEFDASGSHDPDGMIMRYDWDFGDSQTGRGARIIHLFKQAGIYQVTLTVTDNSETKTNTDTATTHVIINAQPVADIGDRIQYTCVGAQTPFNAGGSTDPDGDPLTFTWDFGDGGEGEGMTATHVYQQAGRFKVNVVVDDGKGLPCSQSSISKTVMVNDLPVAKTGPDQRVNPNQLVTFNAAGSYDPDGHITEYMWDFGDGTPVVEGVNTTHSYPNPGKYTVVLTVRDNSGLECSTDSDQMVVSVNAPPVADAGPDQENICSLTVQFDGSGSYDPDGNIILYEWDFGDGSPTQNGVTPVHSYAQPGVYQVTLTVTDDSGLPSGRATDVMQVSINTPPVANIEAPPAVCPGEAVKFSAAGSADEDGAIMKYTWDLGDGSPQITDKVVRHTYDTPGHYTVTLKVTDNSVGDCNTTIATHTIKVNTPPVAVPGPDVITCIKTAGCEVIFDGGESYDVDGDNLSYYWDFGDGNTNTGIKVSHEYDNPGIYTVNLTVEDDSGTICNKNSNTLQVNANAQPMLYIDKKDE